MHSARSENRTQGTLTARSPMVEPLVHAIGVTGPELDNARAFARQLCRDRNAWSVRTASAQRHRPIKRHEAEAELRRALTALNNGGADHG